MDRNLLPYDLQVEQAFLGSVLIWPEAIENAPLPPKGAFFLAKHEQIWRAILDLHSRGGTIDLVTVADELKRRSALEKVGGMPYLVELVSASPSAYNAPEYAKRIADYAMRRWALRQFEKCAASLAGLSRRAKGDVDDVMGSAAQQSAGVVLEECMEQINKTMAYFASASDTRGAGAAADEAIAWMEETARRKTAGEPLSDAPLGSLPSLDKVFLPRKSNYIVVGARPKVGKTALLLSWAMNLARLGKKVLFVSLELSGGELGERLLAMQTGINTLRMRRADLGAVEHQQIRTARAELAGLSLKISDVPGLHVDNLPQIALAAKRELGGLDVVFLDYIGLVQGRGGSEYERQTYVSKRLKRHARFLDVVLIGAHQFNRGVRPHDRPSPDAFKSTGSIEQDVDAALSVYLYPEGKAPTLKTPLEPRIVELMLNRAGTGLIAVPAALNVDRMQIVEITAQHNGIDLQDLYISTEEDLR